MVHVSVFHSGCVSAQYGPPLLLRLSSNYLEDVEHRKVRRHFKGRLGNSGQNKDTDKEMLNLIITGDKQG